MNKLEMIGELRRIARILERGDKELPKRTPLLMKEAADAIEQSLKKTVPISELNLSARAYNALYRHGWLTVEDVKNKGVVDLMRIAGLGETTAREIRDKVTRYLKEEMGK